MAMSWPPPGHFPVVQGALWFNDFPLWETRLWSLMGPHGLQHDLSWGVRGGVTWKSSGPVRSRKEMWQLSCQEQPKAQCMLPNEGGDSGLHRRLQGRGTAPPCCLHPVTSASPIRTSAFSGYVTPEPQSLPVKGLFSGCLTSKLTTKLQQSKQCENSMKSKVTDSRVQIFLFLKLLIFFCALLCLWKDVRSTRARDSCELPCECWQLNLGLLVEQPVLLTA